MVLQAPEFALYSSICLNHNCIPSQSDQAFIYWKHKGVTTIADLYINNHFVSYMRLKETFSLPQAHFVSYLQAEV